MENNVDGQMEFNNTGEIKQAPKNKKVLSKRVKKLIKNEANDVFKANLKEMQSEMYKNITKYILLKNQELKSLNSKDKNQMIKGILRCYIPLKNELKLIEKNFLSDENFKQAEDEYYKKIMKSDFSDATLPIEDKAKKYIEIKRTFNFLDDSINSYISQCKTNINYLQQILDKKYDAKVKILQDSYNRRILILRKHYIEGIPDKIIIDKYYIENKISQRTYYNDKENLLADLTPYFSGVYSILDIY